MVEAEDEEVASRSRELADTADVAAGLRSRSREEEDLRRKWRIHSKFVVRCWEGKRNSTAKGRHGSLGREFRRRFDRFLPCGLMIEDEQDRRGCTESREEVGSRRRRKSRWERTEVDRILRLNLRLRMPPGEEKEIKSESARRFESRERRREGRTHVVGRKRNPSSVRSSCFETSVLSSELLVQASLGIVSVEREEKRKI